MFRSLLLATCLAAGPVRAAEPAPSAPALRSVVLSTGGVGQFSFSAEVAGRATLPLDVPLDQVDDLLKSLHVADPAGGRMSVRLPGKAPLSESFRTLPFGQDAFASPEALLGGLVGEAVRLPSAAVAGGSVAGRILAVTEFSTQLPGNDGAAITHHRLTIATGSGIASVVLEDTPALELTSDALRAQIESALSAIAAQRVQDRRTLQLGLGDGGARTVRFGYVVPVPVWKASYRLTLPDGQASSVRLEGYAVVENLSGRDWHDVDLVLTSGQPVLYHQALYEAVFTQRPEAPVEVPNRLTPAVDAGVAAQATAGKVEGGLREGEMPARPSVNVDKPAAPDVTEPTPAQPPPPPPSPAAVQQAVAQVEFHLADPVTAASGESLLLPIVDRTVPARRVALFRADSNDTHPLVALLLTNDGEGAIPPGLATLFDDQGGFIGDARLPATQPGEQRLASFAADLPVRVVATTSEDAAIVGATAARGVLRLQRREQSLTTYRVTTPASGGRTVLIEHPKREGWTLAEPAESISETPSDHRITIDVPAATTATVRVLQQHVSEETTVLADADADDLATLAADGSIPPKLKAALDRAGSLRAELDRRTAALETIGTRRQAIVDDQDRLRKNLAAVPAGDLRRGYLLQLAAQEKELAQLGAQSDAAQHSVDAAEAELENYLGNLTL